MRILGYTSIALVLLLGGLLAWSMTLDSRWQVERSVGIAAPPGPVFAYVSILRNWPEWTAWNTERYPGMQFVYDGPEWGVGATQRWQGGGQQGELQVTDFLPGEYLEYKLSMNEARFALRGSLRIEPAGEGSRLAWHCWGDTGDNVFRKLMVRFYLPRIGRDFDRGLANLRQRFEDSTASEES